jgi:hypothetical protein
MLTYLLGGLAVVVALLVVVVARRPSHYRIARSTTIAAPTGAVMDLIEDFHQWKRWTPFDRHDPAQAITISGAPRGVSAIYEWTGVKSGQGRMEIVELHPNALVGVQLDFIKPFASRCRCDFELRPAGRACTVEWSMKGTSSFMMKAFTLFKDMDAMVGPDFERGLAQLKAAAESSAGAPGGAPGTIAGTPART